MMEQNGKYLHIDDKIQLKYYMDNKQIEGPIRFGVETVWVIKTRPNGTTVCMLQPKYKKYK